MKTSKFIKIIFLILIGYTTYSQSIKNETADSYYNSAVRLLETGGNLNNALFNINNSINIDPYSSNAYYIKGVIYQRKLSYDLALINFKKAIQVNPKNTDAMMKCGIVYGKKNDIPNCCNYMKMACENGENDGCSTYIKFCK